MKAMICFTHPAWVHQFHHIIWRMRERGDEVLCFVAEKDGVVLKAALAGQFVRASFPEDEWQKKKEEFESWLKAL